ncbi:MAG TPA: hypothetical protein VFR87_07995 [Nocardioidaceae bacterium]|nr:hypothetical protein [Nocardioidaceae bacterium]
MRRRTLEAQILAGAVVAALVTAAVPVAYVAITEGTNAVRSGLHTRALQMTVVALIAAAVGVAAVAVYSHWLDVTDRPEKPRRARVPSRLEVLLEGLVLAVLLLGALPVARYAYRSSLDALVSLELAWAVGYAVAGVAYLWLTVLGLIRYVPWARLR